MSVSLGPSLSVSCLSEPWGVGQELITWGEDSFCSALCRAIRASPDQSQLHLQANSCQKHSGLEGLLWLSSSTLQTLLELGN